MRTLQIQPNFGRYDHIISALRFSDILLVCTSGGIHCSHHTAWTAATFWGAFALSCTGPTQLPVLQIDKTNSHWRGAHNLHSRDYVIWPAGFLTSMGESWWTSPFTAKKHPLLGAFGNPSSSYSQLRRREAFIPVGLCYNWPHIKPAKYHICHAFNHRLT